MKKEIEQLVERLVRMDGKKPKLTKAQVRRIMDCLSDLCFGAPETLSLVSYYGYFRYDARCRANDPKGAQRE